MSLCDLTDHHLEADLLCIDGDAGDNHVNDVQSFVIRLMRKSIITDNTMQALKIQIEYFP